MVYIAAWQAYHGRNRQQKDILQFDEGIKVSLQVRYASYFCIYTAFFSVLASAEVMHVEAVAAHSQQQART